MSDTRVILRPHASHALALVGVSRVRRPKLRDALVSRLSGVLFAAVLASAPSLACAGGTVDVLYAGSLVTLMERGIGPAFQAASGDRFRGYAGGSKLLANEIKGRLRRADVFVSAAPAVDRGLMGAHNGNWVSWTLTFAQSPLVIGYDRASRFAADLKSKPWYVVLRESGIRIGRTDPRLDPKGALTMVLMRRAQVFYRIPGLAARVLGPPENPAQVLPEETLLGRLQSGQLDVGFFYSTEVSDARIPAIRLTPAIAPKALYTVTIVRGAPHPEAAEAFVAFLLGPSGRELMRAHGLEVLQPVLEGKARSMPRTLRPFLKG